MPESKRNQKSTDLNFLDDYDQAGSLNEGERTPEKGLVSNPPSETALDLGKWELLQGKDLVTDSARIQRLYNVESPNTPEEWKSRREAEIEMADFYAAAFNHDPQFAEHMSPSVTDRADFLDRLFESEGYRELHRKCTHDGLLAGIAASAFAEQWDESKDQRDPDNPGDGDGDDDGEQRDGEGERQRHRDARDAVEQANNDVEDMKNVKRAIGHDDGDDGNMTLDEVKELYRRVRGSSRLQEICKRIGRYKRFAAGLQRSKTDTDKTVRVGIETSGSLERALPHELAFLGSDDQFLSDIALRRFLEEQLVSFKLGGNPKVGLGPLVLAVDESGSMGGYDDENNGHGPHIWSAKAIAAAFYDIAKRQKRWLCLASFSGKNSGQFLVIDPASDPKPAEFFDWLGHFYAGGTDPDVVFSRLPKEWESLGCNSQQGKTDICLITDAYIEIGDQMTEDFLTWKAENDVSLTSLILSDEGDEPQDTLDAVSDRVHHLTNLGIENKGIEEVLSV